MNETRVQRTAEPVNTQQEAPEKSNSRWRKIITMALPVLARIVLNETYEAAKEMKQMLTGD